MTRMNRLGSDIKFSREPLTGDLFTEMMPLLKAHYNEIAQFKDVPLDINIEGYISMENTGNVRYFTARKDGELIGYSSYFVIQHPHFNQVVQALGDVIYIKPERRGFGAIFIRWCATQLQREGVQRMYQSVNPQHDFSSMLKKLGFEQSDISFTKKLN